MARKSELYIYAMYIYIYIYKYYTLHNIMHIACTARQGQIACTGVASRSSLAHVQQGMARIIAHCLHSKAWPDCMYWCCLSVLTCKHSIERLVVEHDFAMFRVSFGCIVSLRGAWHAYIYRRDVFILVIRACNCPGNAPGP